MAKAKTRKSVSNTRQSEFTLPDAERDVVACVWSKGTITAKEIREMIHRYRPMAHGSVVTLLTRLESKGLISKKKVDGGREFTYKPARKPDIIYRQLSRDLLDRVFGGSHSAMLTAAIEAKKPSAEEATALRRVVNKMPSAKR